MDLAQKFKLNGLRSVPQIARLRGLARQRIQVLVDKPSNAASFGYARNTNAPGSLP